MAITIDGKQYDDKKLDDKCKNAIIQVSQAQQRLKNISNQAENENVIIKHHSDWLKGNLPAAALIETDKVEDKAAEEKPAEQPKT